MDADSPPQELLEVLLVDLGGLKLVERGGEIGLALSVSRDGLADVMQYARANPDALVVGENVRWLSWDAWDRIVRTVEAYQSLRETPARPLPRVTTQPPPLPSGVPLPPPLGTRRALPLPLPLPDATDEAVPAEFDDGP